MHHFMVLKSFAVVLTLALTASVAPAESPAPMEPKFTPDVLNQLKSGKSVFFEEKRARGQAGVAILVNGAKEDVWRVLSDPESAPRYVPSLKSARILRTSGNTRIIAHEVKMPLMPRVRYQFAATELPMRTIQFKKTAGDLSAMQGEWKLFEGENHGLPGKVIVFHQVYLNPGKLVPAGMVQRSLRKDLPPMIESVRERIYDLKKSAK